LAARENEIDFCGFDISEQYTEIANERLENITKCQK